MGEAGGFFFAAADAAEAVKFGVDPADADLRLEVPVLAQDPIVAVADAGANLPALVAVVGELAEVGAQEVGEVLDAADIVLSADEVGAEVVAVPAVAEPVSDFGHGLPVLPALALAEGPGVEVAHQLEAPLGGEADFGTGVDVEQCVADQVGL